MSIEQAIVAYERRDEETALKCLLTIWRGVRDPQLADLIGAMSERIDRVAIHARTQAQRSQAWKAIASEGDPADIPRLLEMLKTLSCAYLLDLVPILGRWEPDPRIAQFLIGMQLTPPPGASRQGRFLWKRVDQAIAVHCEGGGASSLGENDLGACKRLAGLLSGEDQRPGAGHVKESYDAVYERPDDDDLRLVLADALMEVENPHGEFINLQMRPSLTRKQERRERELLASYERTWLGSIEPVVSRVVYRRGFPAIVSLTGSPKQVGDSVGCPEWGTIDDLSVIEALTKMIVTLVEHPCMRAMRVLRARDTVLQAKTAIPATELYLYAHRYPEALANCEAFPRLRHLDLTGIRVSHPGRLRDLWVGGALGHQLDVLALEGSFCELLEELAVQHIPVPELRITRHRNVVKFIRQPGSDQWCLHSEGADSPLNYAELELLVKSREEHTGDLRGLLDRAGIHLAGS